MRKNEIKARWRYKIKQDKDTRLPLISDYVP